MLRLKYELGCYILTNLLVKLFIKNSEDTSNPQVRERYGKFSGIVGIVTNFFLFLIKIIAGFIFNSISIVADAVNNLSDSGSSLITLIGFKITGKPADAEHPYGHARMEYIAGLIISFIVSFLGFQLIQSSVNKIIHPQTTVFSIVSILVLTASILIKLWQFMFFRKIGRIINSSTLVATSYDSRNDILSTSAVLAATVISSLIGYNLDGYIGVLVALFILISGFKLIMDTISLLLGMAPSDELVERIYKKILSYDGIIGLHDLTVHSYGEGKCFASVHCEVPAEQDIMISHDIVDNIERDFLKDEGIHMVIHLDPVVTNDPKTNELKSMVEDIVRKISDKISIHDFRVVWGVSHSNLIFDVLVPFDFHYKDEELINTITDKIHEINKTYNSVITIDHDYSAVTAKNKNKIST